MDKLEVLFQGFQHAKPPPHFVFMGNFCSYPVTHGESPLESMTWIQEWPTATHVMPFFRSPSP